MNIGKCSIDQRIIRQRVIQMIYESRLSHLGSCLSVIDIIDAVYAVKQKDERFVLSNGHAGFALYAVLEKYKYLPVDAYKKLHLHPDRNEQYRIDVSTGSLGQGLPIALGMALACREKQVYCSISDGECTEGSVWEALRIANEQQVVNLKIVLNANGWAAYAAVDTAALERRLRGFGFELLCVDGHNPASLRAALAQSFKVPTIIVARTSVEQLPFLRGLDAHYYVMNDDNYRQAMEICRHDS